MYGCKCRGEAQAQNIRDERKGKVFIENAVDKCIVYKNCSLLFSTSAVITVEHMCYEVQLQRTLLYHPLAVGEHSLLDSKLVPAENGRGVRDFRLML
ncbi:hypothetical protein TNCV_200351 [Trichonephila clavipes]|nr:hypothetical protein TNCV_200351 [Trichonephila clavipes]